MAPAISPNSTSTLSASATSTGIWIGRQVLANPLDNGIQPHVPHWIIGILVFIFIGILLVTVVTAAHTGAHLATNPNSYTQRKRRTGARSMFKDLKSVWPRAPRDKHVLAGYDNEHGWAPSSEKHYQQQQPYDAYARAPPRYSEANADMDETLSRLTQANTLKNQRRVAAAVAHASGIQYHNDDGDAGEKGKGKEGDASVPPILRPPGARW
ncbi:hypothetical protein HMN09_00007600 [Mycena chlorophos]|uniref:Uncharacterized protein n=1 Tax=Mycena chlorophos TaxID=658473 RepID=A0A8H6TV45_MYCCL|nr:hypothetical protein HMN09_00007600 [Mycena chlorophos]